MKKKKNKTTYERFLAEHPDQKAIMEKEYQEVLISEMLLAAMEEDFSSVRKLAKAAGISPTIVQAVKSGTKRDIALSTLKKLVAAIGYQIALIPNISGRPMFKLS